MNNGLCLVALLAVLLVPRGDGRAEELKNNRALAQLKEVRVYFDVNIGEPEKLLKRLKLIGITNDHLVGAGLAPRFVIGIRGKASNFFTRGEGYVLDIDLPVKKEIASAVEQLKAKGYRLEQCELAAGMQEISPADFLPQLELVDNGYVSMINYQHQGYAYVPMD